MDNKKDNDLKDLPQPDGLKIPKQTFYKFYPGFDKVSDISEDEEWDVYSQFYYFDEFEKEIEIHLTEEEINGWGNPDSPYYNPDRIDEEMEKCAASFPYFCHRYVKILHPTEGALPCVLYNYQRRVVEAYENNRYTILSKFRQGGLTMTAVLWSLWRCMFKYDQQIMILSKTDREAMAAGEIGRFALKYLPQWLQPEMHENSKHEKHFTHTRSVLKFYTPEAARGKSLTILIVDEAAFISDMEKYWSDMYPTIGTGGKAIIISTVNGMGNWYEETYHLAQSGRKDFFIVDLDYWEHPEYVNPAWVRNMRKNLGEKLFAQEILRSFLDSGETYIPGRVILELEKRTEETPPLRTGFSNWNIVGMNINKNWEDGALWIWKEPKDGHEYIIGVDCAEGVGEDGDNNTFQILDMATLEQVAEFYSNICPPNIFSQIIYEIGYYYNTAMVVVENNGVGAAVCKSLQHDLAYENLYYDTKKKARERKVGVQIGPATRPVYLESLQHRLVNNTLKVNSKRFVEELRTFIFNAQKKRAEAKKGKHDDAIMSLCIALYIRDTQVYDMPVGAEVPEEMMQIFKAEVFKEIREEILRDSPEDWISDKNKDDPIFIDDDQMMVGVLFDIRRQNEELLQEFGWAWLLPFWGYFSNYLYDFYSVGNYIT